MLRGFSKASRRRLQTWLNSLNQAAEGLPLFVTLTYPGASEWNTIDRARFKRDLDGFLKRLRRAVPAAHGIWKLEPQKRGAPHYHLLVWGVSFLPIAQLSRMWWEVVGSDDEANLKNGVHIVRAESWRGVAFYAAKYVAKVVRKLPRGWTEPGRWWGKFNRGAFQIVRETIEVSRTTAIRIRRLGARVVFRASHEALVKYLANREAGLTVFADESATRKALAWAETPRWRTGLVRPGGSAYFRRLLANRSRRAPDALLS